MTETRFFEGETLDSEPESAEQMLFDTLAEADFVHDHSTFEGGGFMTSNAGGEVAVVGGYGEERRFQITIVEVGR